VKREGDHSHHNNHCCDDTENGAVAPVALGDDRKVVHDIELWAEVGDGMKG
jgi:hypothetical protein